MSTEIYYFSGTGNSLVVARDIAGKMNANLIPVISMIDQESINTDADVIGIVFPIYDFKPPLIIRKFVSKLKNISSKYIFAVGTYGITPSKSMKNFDKVIKSCGGNLSAGFAVSMPHNGIGSSLFSKTQHEIMFKNWKIKLEEISEYVIAGKKGNLETSNMFVSLILSGLFIKMMPSLLKLLRQVIIKGWKSLAFISNEKCDGCGICQKICPVNNIELVDNKPSWSSHCAGCLACLHWCPKEALQLGSVNMNIKKYHHPDVKISDMI
jgi:Pyruvate/2-oxoacid:ferredoxin oxidoreductase delta subunit/flavodoxin